MALCGFGIILQHGTLEELDENEENSLFIVVRESLIWEGTIHMSATSRVHK